VEPLLPVVKTVPLGAEALQLRQRAHPLLLQLLDADPRGAVHSARDDPRNQADDRHCETHTEPADLRHANLPGADPTAALRPIPRHPGVTTTFRRGSVCIPGVTGEVP
jgi:hypothetical protein